MTDVDAETDPAAEAPAPPAIAELVPPHAWWVIVGVLLLTALVRLAWIEGMSWHADNPLHFLRAAELARGERIDVLCGYQTRAGGAHLPPIYHYYLAIPIALGGGAVAAVAWVVAGQVALAALILMPGRRLIGRDGSLIAALAFAASPGLSMMARGLRNEVVVLPFVALLIGLQVLALRRPRSALAGWAFAASTAVGQLHLSGLFILLGSGPLTLYQMGRAGLRRSLPGLALGLLLLAPFAAHELGGGFREIRALVGGSVEEPSSAEAVVRAPRSAVLVDVPSGLASWFRPAIIGRWTGPEVQARLDAGAGAPVSWGAGLFGWTCVALLAGGAVCNLLGRGPLGPRAGPILVGLNVLTWAGFVLVGVYSPAYVLVLVPYACVHIGCAAELGGRSLRRLRPAARAVALGLFVAAALCSALLSLQYWARIDRAGGVAQKPYGPSYRSIRDMAEWILEEERSLRRYPRYQYVLTLDMAFRDLPEERKALFEPRRVTVPYWGLPFLVPLPRRSAGAVSIYEYQAPPGARPLRRSGFAVAVEGTPGPPPRGGG